MTNLIDLILATNVPVPLRRCARCGPAGKEHAAGWRGGRQYFVPGSRYRDGE